MCDTVDDEDAHARLRRNMSLYMDCNCGGPQPSLNNARADEHARTRGRALRAVYRTKKYASERGLDWPILTSRRLKIFPAREES